MLAMNNRACNLFGITAQSKHLFVAEFMQIRSFDYIQEYAEGLIEIYDVVIPKQRTLDILLSNDFNLNIINCVSENSSVIILPPITRIDAIISTDLQFPTIIPKISFLFVREVVSKKLTK